MGSPIPGHSGTLGHRGDRPGRRAAEQLVYISQAQALLPDAVHAAREQGPTWASISRLLNLSPAAAARRYRRSAP
ncbi:MAG: hypothetical protein ACYCV4_12895 [Dermatophilaceae bacterium]